MSEMIERVGAAMMRTGAGRKLTREFTDIEIRDFARAAIEEMRNPTEAMLEAASIEAQKPAGWHMVYRNILRAMIDAALKA